VNASLLLLIATLALVVGPLLERVASRLPVLAALVDGATVGGIVIVALLHLMPESAAHLGWWAFLAFAVGLALPLATERLLVRSWQGLRITVGALVLVLFVGHLLVEGAALASTANNERLALATVLVVAGHNLPLGVLLWGQTRRRFGSAWSVAVIAAVGAITWFGPQVIEVSEGNFSAVCSAVLAGGLLHLVLQHEPLVRGEDARRARNLWSSVGAITAAVILVLYLGAGPTSVAHAHGSEQLPGRFLELFLETATPLFLGVIGAALIEAFMPVAAARWLSGGSSASQALRGVVIGAPMPVCSCGVLPIYRSLVLRGVPATAALALLVAAPEIGIDSILLSLPLLGTQTTIARFVAALVLALAVGWIVGQFAERTTARTAPKLAEQASPPRLDPPLVSIRRAFLETWGHLAPWILVGLYAAALIEPWLSPTWARSLPPWLQIAVLSLLGMPAYICATAATPLAAMLLHSGFSPGAVIAFLLTGPATNLTTFGALRRLHSRAVAFVFAATALAVTFAIGLAVNAFLPGGSVKPVATGVEHSHGIVTWISAAALCALTVWVLVREGPRQFVAQLDPGAEERARAHQHGSGDHDGHAGHAHGEEGGREHAAVVASRAAETAEA
jgi:uncharacterized membrane protein YraQ (UPF0718 family)